MKLKDDLEILKTHYLEEKVRRDLLLEQKKDLKEEKKTLDEEVDTLEKVSILFQKTSKYARDQGKTQIENLTTRSLEYIFKEDYKFEIELSEKRSNPSADFYILEENENGQVRTKPELSKGGGIIDIVSLALRLSFMENYRPKIEGPLILDEPGKHVSEDFVHDIGTFLLEFSKQMDRQIIMITHDPHLAEIGDRTFVVSKNDGISQVQIR